MAVRQDDVIEAAHDAPPTTLGIPDANGSIWVPLDRLKDSPKNVRTVPHTESHIRTLAALIHTHRQLYPLVVEPEVGEAGVPTGFYLVTAGKGRRRAQLERVKQKQIPADHPIWCVIGAADQARELSLADNVHEPMHPADQFAAFKALIDEGRSIEDVAARFAVTPLVVQRRLKLANVAPEFVEMYRRDELTLEHMMALALTDDHEQQRAAWNSLPKGNRAAEWLRDALVADEVPLSSALARFVGNAYEKAGGAIRRDLFSAKDDEGFVMDVPLLMRLATEKLEKTVARLKKEGCAWAESGLKTDYSELATFGRVGTVLREPTEQEAARLQEISRERKELESETETLEEDDERHDTLDEKLSALGDEEEAIIEARAQPDPEQQALAGAIVTIDPNGKVRIERGLLRPEDKKRFAARKKGSANDAGATSGAPVERTHSAALLRRLSAHRTAALQAVLADRPDVALVALTHRLIAQTFFEFAHVDSAVEVVTHQTSLDGYASDVAEAKAFRVFEQRKADVLSHLPKEPEALLLWLLKQPQSDVLGLLAVCVVTTLHGVQDKEGPSPLDELARAVGLDMREWWTTTAANYFGSVPKDRIIDAVSEAVSPEAASALRVMKKADAARLAEERVAGSGWLPKVLRTSAA